MVSFRSLMTASRLTPDLAYEVRRLGREGRYNDEFSYDGIRALRRIYTSPQGATKAQLAAVIKYYTLGLLNNNNK